MKWLLLMVLLGAPLAAQSFDEARSRFLSAPHGRTGTWAPYRVELTGLEGLDTVTVRSVATGVALEKQVAAGGLSRATVVVPVFVHDSARLQVGDTIIRPELPTRRVEPDYARAYTAVFSTDPMYARGVLPSTPTGAICDYYALDEFFGDWRLLDGYDAVVVFNPTDLRLPAGSQRAIADFCSLGGVVLIAGSFRFGESGVNVPAPAEPTLPVFRGVQALRYGYGAGAIYRFGFNELRDSPSAHLVLGDALHDHMWFAANRAPAGTPESRIPPTRAPHPSPLPRQAAAPAPLFWGLAGALLLVCGLAPVIAGRVTRRVEVGHLALILACLGIGGGGLAQELPLPVLEVSAIVHAGEGEPASARLYVQVDDTWGDLLTVSLDDDTTRDLPRHVGVQPGRRAWAIDRPLTSGHAGGKPASLRQGQVGELSFRDFATQAHRGGNAYSGGEAYLLDWWLEQNAYRGRGALLTPGQSLDRGFALSNTSVIWRGAIRVTTIRE